MANSHTAKTIPCLLANNLDATLLFYVEKLKFRESARWPDNGPIKWLEVERDGFALQFFSDPPKGSLSVPAMTGTVYIFPNDLESLIQEWQDLIDFAWGPKDMDYGLREFAFKDPNGYYFAFAMETNQA